MLALFVLSSCATQKKGPYKRLPPHGKKPAPTAPAPARTPEELERAEPQMRRTNAIPSTQDKVTPKRHASMRLVERGKTMIDENDPEAAVSVLRDAINIDPSNGVAYFYLANANIALGNAESAAGLLDKAEALLGADEEWMEKIDELRGGGSI